jgi:hypothetical protein
LTPPAGRLKVRPQTNAHKAEDAYDPPPGGRLHHRCPDRAGHPDRGDWALCSEEYVANAVYGVPLERR